MTPDMTNEHPTKPSAAKLKPDHKGTDLQQPGSQPQKPGLRGALARWVDFAAQHMPEKWFLIYISTIVGLMIGFGTWVLSWLIRVITSAVRENSLVTDHRWMVLFLPLIGFGLTSWLANGLVKQKLEFCSQYLRNLLYANRLAISWKQMWAPIVGCGVTMGFGGSAGSGGPIALAGGAMGSNVALYFRLKPQYVRILIGVGAGAGMAAVFRSPLGGVFYTLEILQMELSSVACTALMVGSLAAWGTDYLLSGCSMDISYDRIFDFNIHMLPGFVCLGLVCGLYSMYYSYMLQKAESITSNVRHIWLKVLIAGLSMGVIAYIFPQLYGEGYDSINKALSGHAYAMWIPEWDWHEVTTGHLMILLLGLTAIKALATALTNGGGGCGGEFTPTLFAGGMLGLLFALCCNTWLGMNFRMEDFGLCGMAGVMSGGVGAPLMAMFLVVEMCGDCAMFFPIMAVAFTSFVVTQCLGRNSNFMYISAFKHLKL